MTRLLATLTVVAMMALAAGLFAVVTTERAFAQTGGGGVESDPVECTGRSSDPDSCKELREHGNPQMVATHNPSDQRRIESIHAQMDSRNERYVDDYPRRTEELAALQVTDAALTSQFLNSNPTLAESAVYFREKARLERLITAKQRQIETLTSNFNDEMERLVEQIGSISDRAAENLARQTAVCDTTPGVGSGPDEDNPLTRWYVCTYLDEDGNELLDSDGKPLPWYPLLDEDKNEITGESAHQDAVAISVQEYRRFPIPVDQAERETRPIPPLDDGQYHSEDFCEFFEDGCREVRRGHYSYWVSTSPPEPRFRSSRTYDNHAECIAVHGQCTTYDTEIEHSIDNNGDPATTTKKTVSVPAASSEYISADQCEQSHRTCEPVRTPSHAGSGGEETLYVPTITGRVYTDSAQCGMDHGGCEQYRRDSNDDGVVNGDDDIVYVPHGSSEVVVTVTHTGTLPTGQASRSRESIPSSDSRAPDRSEPDEEPVQETIPHSAVHVDAQSGQTSPPSDTSPATGYSTGSECLESGTGAGVVCGQGDDGNWYRLRSWK